MSLPPANEPAVYEKWLVDCEREAVKCVRMAQLHLDSVIALRDEYKNSKRVRDAKMYSAYEFVGLLRNTANWSEMVIDDAYDAVRSGCPLGREHGNCWYAANLNRIGELKMFHFDAAVCGRFDDLVACDMCIAGDCVEWYIESTEFEKILDTIRREGGIRLDV